MHLQFFYLYEKSFRNSDKNLSLFFSILKTISFEDTFHNETKGTIRYLFYH